MFRSPVARSKYCSWALTASALSLPGRSTVFRIRLLFFWQVQHKSVAGRKMTMKGHSWFQRSQNLEYPMDGLPVPLQIFVYVLQSPCFVRCDGRSLTSILLKPGTCPGKRRACSSAVFKINFTTCSTVSAEEVLLGSRFLFPCTRKHKVSWPLMTTPQTKFEWRFIECAYKRRGLKLKR